MNIYIKKNFWFLTENIDNTTFWNINPILSIFLVLYLITGIILFISIYYIKQCYFITYLISAHRVNYFFFNNKS